MKSLKLNKTVKRTILSLIVLVLVGLGIGVKDAQSFSDNVVGQYLTSTQPGFYEVVYINDGDTITVRANNREDKVRFIGIDTPEKDHPSKPVQCFSYAATDYLTKLLGDNDVKLVADPTNSNRDRYDRLLRYVYLPDGTNVNAKMIEEGYAFAYTSFPVTQMDEFVELERLAREANRGLWNACEIEQSNGFISTNPI